MTSPIASLCTEVGGALGDLRDVVDGLCDEEVEIDGRQLRMLRELFGVGVEWYPVGNRCELVRAGAGENVRVRILAGIPAVEDRFYQLQAVGRVLFRHRAWADAFALKILALRGGDEDLRYVDPAPLWYQKHYPRLTDLLPEIVPRRSGTGKVGAYAAAAGRVARLRGEHAAAESWLDLAETLGGGSLGDPATLASVHLNRGLLLKERDGTPSLMRAGGEIGRALEIARSHGLTELHQKCAHDLAAIAIERRAPTEALGLVRQAFALYGPTHPLAPRLIHDLGHLWIEEGLFSDAATVLAAALPRATDVSTRGSILGNLARAVAALGDREAFARLWSSFDPLWRAMPVWEAGCALLNVSAGASMLGDTDRAKQSALSAFRLAQTHQLADVLQEADRLITAAQNSAPWLGSRQDPDVRIFAAEVARAFAGSP